MPRLSALLVALLPALVLAADPPPKGKPLELPATQFPDITSKPLTKYDPEVDPPRVWTDFWAQFEPPKLPGGNGADSPVVKLAKANLVVVVGGFTRGHLKRDNFGLESHRNVPRFAAALAAITRAADDAFEKPADRLPWYEYRVRVAKAVEESCRKRAEFRLRGEELQGIDPPYVLPLASVLRLDAEIALLKLKAKIGN